MLYHSVKSSVSPLTTEMNHNFVSLDRCLVVFHVGFDTGCLSYYIVCVALDYVLMKASCVQSLDFRETKYQSHFQS